LLHPFSLAQKNGMEIGGYHVPFEYAVVVVLPLVNTDPAVYADPEASL
jgi:cytochrome P450